MKKMIYQMLCLSVLFGFQSLYADTPPTVAAPVPPYPRGDVHSFIGETYGEDRLLSTQWDPPTSYDYASAGDDGSCFLIRGLGAPGENQRWLPLKLTRTTPEGADLVRLKDYQYVHIDVYCNEPTYFKFGFHTHYPYDCEQYFPTIQPDDMTPGQWYSIEYPLADFLNTPKWSMGDAALLRFRNDDEVYPASNEIYIDNFFVFVGTPHFLPSSLEKVQGGNGLKIYPSIVSESFTVETQTAIQKISIYNVTGQVVKELTTLSGSINISDLSAGTYIVSVLSADGSRVSKRIIKR
jgi:hypothetical protein